MDSERFDEISELQLNEEIMYKGVLDTLSDDTLYIDEKTLEEKYSIRNFRSGWQSNLQKVFIVVIHEENDNYFLYHERDAAIAFEKFRMYGEYNKNNVKETKYLSLPIKLSRIQVQIMIEQGICLLCQRYIKENCKGQVSIPVDIPSEEIIRKNAITAVKGRKRKAVQSLSSILCSGPTLENQENENYEKLSSIDVSSEEIEDTVRELKEKFYKKRRVVKEGTFEHNLYGCYYLPCELPSNQSICNQNYGSKLMVYRDLWRKGFWLVDGCKFGGDYLAYDKTPMGNHSRFIVIVCPSSKSITPLELIATLRIATQVKKDLLLAITDDETLVPHYSIINWWKGDDV
uniref:tRNA-intron lyase n=1 Tax=Strongyloides venezuelensis TaxID=75913 RepID=A0A0K0F3R3_STRVS